MEQTKIAFVVLWSLKNRKGVVIVSNYYLWRCLNFFLVSLGIFQLVFFVYVVTRPPGHKKIIHFVILIFISSVFMTVELFACDIYVLGLFVIILLSELLAFIYYS